MVKAMLAVSVLVSMLLGGKTREFVSPAGNARVVIRNFCEGGGVGESAMQIVNERGDTLLRKSFTSEDAAHGYGITRVEWTADSRFFVFCMTSSGGHQPWHVPTSIYSVADNHIISIDRTLGPVTSLFRVLQPDSLRFSYFTTDNPARRTATISLSRFVRAKD